MRISLIFFPWLKFNCYWSRPIMKNLIINMPQQGVKVAVWANSWLSRIRIQNYNYSSHIFRYCFPIWSFWDHILFLTNLILESSTKQNAAPGTHKDGPGEESEKECECSKDWGRGGKYERGGVSGKLVSMSQWSECRSNFISFSFENECLLF